MKIGIKRGDVRTFEQLDNDDFARSPPPRLRITNAPSRALLMAMLTFRVECLDGFGNDRSALVQWFKNGSDDLVTIGPEFVYAIDYIGEHSISAKYVDRIGREVEHTVIFVSGLS